MAHELDMSNNRANMAYVGEVPWHGLGFKLPDGRNVDQWRKAAGLDWEVKRAPVLFENAPNISEFEGKDVLYRSDTRAPLGVVSDRYKIVHPKDILEFYRDLVKGSMFEMETAGSLFGGKRIWALAKSKVRINIQGVDLLKGYLLLATSTDGTMSTIATCTSVRVVCNNTLHCSLAETQEGHITVPHNVIFEPELVKEKLGVAERVYKEFESSAEALAKTKVSEEEAVEFFVRLLTRGKEVSLQEDSGVSRTVGSLYDIFCTGPGSDLKSAKGTAWGLVNAVTRFCDFETSARTPSARLASAWFGQHNAMKSRAMSNALLLAA